MKIKVLGCSGAEFPNFNPPAFLVDEKILLDAGTTTAMLSEKAQRKITHILITHAHLDHVRGIPTLVDNMFLRKRGKSITLIGMKQVVETVRENLFNDKLWPDFTRIPSTANPMLKLKAINTGKTFKVLNYRITAEKVNHSINTSGYIIEGSDGKRLLYTGDTGPTSRIWERANRPACRHLSAAGRGRAINENVINGAIIEVSFPNSMRESAIRTGHLTPAMFFDEFKKLKRHPEKTFITHIKPQFLSRVSKELFSLKIKNLKLLKTGETYNI